MKYKWEVDDATVVEARFGAFGKQLVSVNGRNVAQRRTLMTKGALPFVLIDGRAAMIAVGSSLTGRPNVDLRVEGRLYAPNAKGGVQCSACGASAKPYDQFCGGCGKSLPSAEQRIHQRQVKDATGAMRALAWLFLATGLAMFFLLRWQAGQALTRLAGLDDTAALPVEGMTYTVAQLRAQLRWEPWALLITNGILAGVMAGLARVGRRSPLPAVLVATATYAVVIVLNAIADPRTIGQGIIVKIIIIGLFAKGIKAALALRAVDA